MGTQDQLDYLVSRQRLQTELKERATIAEIIAFHDGLATHYQHLVDDVRATMGSSRTR